MIGRNRSRQAALLVEVNRVLDTEYPTLRITRTHPRIIVKGLFPVRLEQTTLDYFLIEIEFPNDYPKTVPSVRETGNRIPQDLDHHLIEGAVFCLFLPDEQWKYWGEGKSVQDFFSETVNDFLLGQVYFERHKRFPFGERRHGVQGIYDYYSEELGTTDKKIIEQCIKFLSRRGIKGHWKCYCGSGKRLRYCHREKAIELGYKVPFRTARVTLFRLYLAKLHAKEEKLKRQTIPLHYGWQLAVDSLIRRKR